ncbi:alkaline phosphatase-like protein [Ophiobolus disseminans]|uniref:Alkaline phosphatase-like protein n=1 Tax=Ophiobolus disseminans TaxID=1469910 RepID=A0A6A7A0Y4_9PLEO|nr:alkaline phosphatase-like protein [Ophiobolus disseminans]
MQLNYLAPFQAIARPKNQFALFFVGFFVAKLLHLGSHFGSLPIVLYLLYFPTFLLPDFLLLVGSKVLVYRLNGGQCSTVRKVFGGILAIFTVSCAAAQISFFVETGGEIQWMAASKVVGGSGGLGLLLSGLPALSVAFVILYVIALVIAPRFYDIIERFLDMIVGSFRHSYSLIRKKPVTESKTAEEHELLIAPDEEQHSSPTTYERPDLSHGPARQIRSTATAVAVTITTLGACIVVLILQYVRPITPPYSHMSGSLPVTIIEAAWFQPVNSEFCLPHPVEVVPFPFERFAKFFDSPQSNDWLPRAQNCTKQNGSGPPPWLEHPGPDGPGPHGHGPPPGHHGPPSGHHGPPPGHHGPPEHQGPPSKGPPHGSQDSEKHTHRPGRKEMGEHDCEPLKLSNLDANLIGNLADKLKNKKPVIKNVLFLTLESTRKDVFPLMKNGHPHKMMLSSYGHTNVSAYVDEKLADFGTTAEFLTGQPTGFERRVEEIPKNDWRSSFKDGMGAINVNGAITQAAYTLKSLLSSHCGVEPLAVDFTEEVQGRIYQPCLPHILEKMSEAVLGKESDQWSNDRETRDASKSYHSWGWESAEVQSVTDQFDSQDVLHEKMGFHNVVAESTISDPKSKHYPPKQPFVNYFGYPETETLDYLRDLFVDGKQNQKRVFVSHLTSSPHHPFHTPKNWKGKTTYMSSQRFRSADPFDDYLNTIQYQDEWISQVFQMLHDVDALKETLVVMTGDHGLAFTSLDNSQSAVANGHIGNFEIPFLFVHPDLPRLQINASTTPLSIIPTVLDLMLQSDSLPAPAADIAKDIVPKYQGHSLIRDLDFTVLAKDGSLAKAFFQPFHFSAINPGGALLAISDASTTFRLILPLCSAIPLRFTDLATDPHELSPATAWTMDELAAILKVRYGIRATEWARLAEDLGRWWVWNQRGKWNYWGSARETSRGGAEVGGGRGRIKKKHWWETK